MRTIIVVLALGLLAIGTHRLIAAEQSSNGKCAELTSLRLPDVTVSEAAAVPAASSGPIRAAHCRVSGVIGTEIRFQLLLPDNWNQKFFMGGGGGFVGSIQNSAQTTVNLGFATAGTDTGHQGAGTDASWAHNNIERQVNFGYLAVHRTAETAKAIIASYYGTRADAELFPGLLPRRRPGADGGAAFPGRLRRHHLGRARLRLDRNRRRDDSEHAGALSGSATRSTR